ncbi:MAG: TIGR03905 family TSCPD domain-containing protein [Clostridia bacterium]|nr:TIGR03905 family TSCPD domain-containing protein [Clostridia bacterium]MBR3144312.1 TIGR03905 family TSCPD domain-containing protein [Clostridia bacterium]
MKYEYNTFGTCSRKITFDLEDDKVKNINFEGGCNGNLKAISKLVDGWSPEKIEQYLKGNTCGGRPTSCADQLARAVMEAKATANK